MEDYVCNAKESPWIGLFLNNEQLSVHHLTYYTASYYSFKNHFIALTIFSFFSLLVWSIAMVFYTYRKYVKQKLETVSVIHEPW